MINVCLSCDENYAKYAAVVIASILKNATAEDKLHFYILDGNISQNSKNKILSLKMMKECSIDFVTINENDFKDYKNIQTHKYISIAACYRLKLPSLLPQVKKVIYLDCDVIVCSSLESLFNADLQNNVIGGVLDIDIKRKNYASNYVNSGVLLMDLDKMRDQSVENTLLTYTQQNINNITLGDQEIINSVLSDKILNIDEKFNVQSECYIRRSSFTKNPVIVHFIGTKKPWQFASWSYHKSLYFKYLQQTPWKVSKLKLVLYWGFLNKIASFMTWFKHRPLFFLQTKFWNAVVKTYFYSNKEDKCL